MLTQILNFQVNYNTARYVHKINDKNGTKGKLKINDKFGILCTFVITTIQLCLKIIYPTSITKNWHESLYG